MGTAEGVGTPVVHTLTQRVDAIKGDPDGPKEYCSRSGWPKTRQLESDAGSAKW
jgi:hypothetical protein